MTPTEILENSNLRAQTDFLSALSDEQRARVVEIVTHAETLKAVVAALMTSLVKKIHTPEQDIRLHKVEMSGGYSGRSFDTLYVTPFVRRTFPRLAMKSGSGWLTRSIE